MEPMTPVMSSSWLRVFLPSNRGCSEMGCQHWHEAPGKRARRLKEEEVETIQDEILPCMYNGFNVNEKHEKKRKPEEVAEQET